jgi:hypothetical protein
VTGTAPPAVTARVLERRRAVALARHYRDFEGLTIRQIADRLGRSPATVKAYFYDPSELPKVTLDTPVVLLLFFDGHDPKPLLALNVGDKIIATGQVHAITKSVVALDHCNLVEARRQPA